MSKKSSSNDGENPESTETVILDEYIILYEDDSEESQVAKRRRPNEPGRTTRQRNPVSRLGVTEDEINDDDRFILAQQKHQEENERTQQMETRSYSESIPEVENVGIDESSTLAAMSAGEKVIFKRLLAMAADIKVLKSRMLECTVQNPTTRLNKNVDKTKLLEIGLPLTETKMLGKFEYDLLNEDFKKKVFDVLKVIGGTVGRSNAESVLPVICGYIFDNDFLKNITWTGKSTSKTNKKLAMKDYKGVVELITDLCLAADKNYTMKKCEQDLIYKVFKYAYRKKANNDARGNELGAVASVDSDTTNSPSVHGTMSSQATLSEVSKQSEKSENVQETEKITNTAPIMKASAEIVGHPMLTYAPPPMALSSSHMAYSAIGSGPPMVLTPQQHQQYPLYSQNSKLFPYQSLYNQYNNV